MTLLDLVQILQKMARENGKKIFLLREIAALANVSAPAAGMALIRAGEKNLVFRIKNLWVNRTDPPELKDLALTLSSPSYISFESALYHHHILSQSPRGELTVATRGRPALIETPLGNIRFIHLKAPLFFGYDPARMALPEKAWLDLLYRRSRRGAKEGFAEKFYLHGLNRKRLREFSKKFPKMSAG